jgi:formate C-acetyltransferase
MKSDRICQLEKYCFQLAAQRIPSHFRADYYRVAQEQYAGLPLWEKAARSMAFAVENQDIHVHPNDGIGGRTYHDNRAPIASIDPDLDYWSSANARFFAEYPEAKELERNQLITGVLYGHIAWRYDRLLELGVTGLREECLQKLAVAADEEAEYFYQGVLIMLDALLNFNDKHVEAYRNIGRHDLADRMAKVPRFPAETFAEAVQAYFMQHLVVHKENPYGGNSPGRLDYYLWPYLKRDLEAGRCTMEDAKELIDELFLRIDERIHHADGTGETIVVGGTAPDGSSAVNPLTYIMVQSIIDLNITHPYVYIRVPEDPPQELMDLCTHFLMEGNNRAQILSDKAIIGALVKSGVPFEDAVDYICGGCMEISVQGKACDLLYIGWHNVAKTLELMITGGECLRTGKKISGFAADKSLAAYSDFESFYQDFIAQTRHLVHMSLQRQDLHSERMAVARPSYLLSSMVDDCLERGRNLQAGGARYHDYGATPIAIPNAADGLNAIRCAVFERKLCTAGELLDALRVDFKGYEWLQAQLKSLPKYGQGDEAADSMMCRLVSDISEMYSSYRTRWGGCGKVIALTFTFAPVASKILGATADGNNAGHLIAQGITPQSRAMTEGITTAILSNTKIDYSQLPGGASTMWDLDGSWVKEPLLEALLRAFLDRGGQIFQGNTISVEELLKAAEHPEDYGHLIVRVGGYSARFVTLPPALQKEIIQRKHHSC